MNGKWQRGVRVMVRIVDKCCLVYQYMRNTYLVIETPTRVCSQKRGITTLRKGFFT